MAENDTSGLEMLIKQRINRPSFARMISWEILKSSGDPPQKSGKLAQRRKKTLTTEEQEESEEECEEEDEQLSESDDSEYFSAEEYLKDENRENNAGECDSDDRKANDKHVDVSDEEESDDREANDRHGDVSDEEEISSSFLALGVTANCDERTRGRSKKQKKKRRKQMKEGNTFIYHYAEYTAPFQCADSINFSIDDLREEIMNRTENVSAIVPSLFELCAKAIWSKNSRISAVSYQFLPGPMKQVVSLERQSQAFTSLQLSCLYRNLAQLESKADEYKQCLKLLSIRNVWSKCFGLRSTEHRRLEVCYSPTNLSFEGSEVTLVIPFSYATFGLMDYNQISFHCNVEPRIMLYTTSLLASVLDLMMPIHFRPTRKKDKGTSCLNKEDQSLVTCADVIFGNLEKRYPRIVEMFKHKVLPYLYWLRGHSKLALEQFLQMSESATDVVEKVYHLLEAARLCQLQNEMEVARKLFHQSHDLLLDTPSGRRSNHDRQEINEQLYMLCANTYDQGVLTKEKAMKSLTSWKYLTTLQHVHAASSLAAAESVLCFHLSHLPGQTVQEKIQSVLGHVNTCSHRCWMVSMYLSLMQAWLGKHFESCEAYRRIMVENPPGQEFKPKDMRQTMFTPWQLVFDTVAIHKRDLRLLPVVWRTQLGFFRVVTDLYDFYGDLQSRRPQLRLSPEGNLTDDLHILLPPVRAVNLDLYTGKLILPSTPGQTHVQQTLLNSWFMHDHGHGEGDVLMEFPNGSYALTSTELFSDDTGRKVHFLSTGEAVLQTHTAVSYLQLTSANGQRTRLNLKQALKTAVENMMKDCIMKTYHGSSNRDRLIALKGLEYASKHNLTVASVANAHYIGNVVQQMEDKKKDKPSNQKHKYRHNTYTPRYPKEALRRFQQFDYRVKDFVSFGHTVFLAGRYDAGYLFLVFLDTSTRETFTSPKVYVTDRTVPKDVVFEILGRQGHTIPRSCVLCYHTSHDSTLKVYDQGGKELQPNAADLNVKDCQCVLASSVYCIENLYSRNQGSDVIPTLMEMRFYHSGPREVFLYDFDPEMRELKTVADRLLLVRSDGLRILNPDTMLPEPMLLSLDSECQCKLSDDSMALLIEPVRVSVLAEKKILSPTNSSTVLVPVAVNDYLLVLGIQERYSSSEPLVEIAFCVKVPGHVTEAYFIGQTVGYLISATFHHQQETSYYRETVCQLSTSGRLLAILPCLGPGPRSFCPVLLPPAPSQDSENTRPEQSTWHVYMRDGHEGIIAVRL